MIIRPMEKDDLERIVELEKELFTTSWSYDDLIYELEKNPFARYDVLCNQKLIIGYIGLWFLGDQSQITTIGIAKEYQGYGYSRLLMEHAIALTRDLKYCNMNLEVRVSNNKAISLYESYGFKKEAIRKNYYQDNHEDAYLMIKEMEE